MHDNRRKPNYLKLIIGALAVLTGLALCAVVVIVVVGAFRASQEGRESLGTVQEAFQTSPEKAKEVFQTDREISQEVQMVDIVPSPRIVSLQDAGDSQRLSIHGFYSDGSERKLEIGPGEEVSYRSSDPSVARVDSEGVVTGTTIGGADVVVSYGDFEAAVPILVLGPVRRIPSMDPDRLLQVSDDGSAIVLNRVMAKLEPGYGPVDAGQVASSIGGEVVFEFLTFSGYVIQFDAHTKEDLDEALAVLRADRRVSVAYPDMVMPTSNGNDAPDPVETLTNIKNAGQGYQQAGMVKAWAKMNDLAHNVDPVIIAVIDNHFPNPKPGDLEYHLVDREFDNRRIIVKDLVAGKGPTKHGAAVTSVMVAKNNIPPFSPNGFSGVVASVDELEYRLIFFEAGQENKERFDEKALVTAMKVINALEDLKRYQVQVDVVNLSFEINCNMSGPDCGFQYELAELIRGMPDVTFVVGAGNKI